MMASKGDFICRGESGELWPQKRDDLLRKYRATGEIEVHRKLRWETYLPRRDTAGVMAAKMDRPFRVRATWGDLEGKPGDYLVKHDADREVAYPADVWIVDGGLFEATYERVEDG